MNTGRIEVATEGGEARGFEVLTLKATEDVREDVQASRRCFRRMECLLHTLAVRYRERRLEQEHGDQVRIVSGDFAVGRSADDAGGERGRPPQPATFEHGRALGPGDERVAVDARPDVCAGQRHGLAQVERRCQLRDRVLPGVHFVQRGRLFEPFRQSLFTRTRTGDR